MSFLDKTSCFTIEMTWQITVYKYVCSFSKWSLSTPVLNPEYISKCVDWAVMEWRADFFLTLLDRLLRWCMSSYVYHVFVIHCLHSFILAVKYSFYFTVELTLCTNSDRILVTGQFMLNSLLLTDDFGSVYAFKCDPFLSPLLFLLPLSRLPGSLRNVRPWHYIKWYIYL